MTTGPAAGDLLVVDSLHGLVRAVPLGPPTEVRPVPDSVDALVSRLALWQAEFVAGQASATVRAVRADWTQYDPNITQELSKLGRSGVPTYVIYPAGAQSQPDVLPEALSKGIVLDELYKLKK